MLFLFLDAAEGLMSLAYQSRSMDVLRAAREAHRTGDPMDYGRLMTAVQDELGLTPKSPASLSAQSIPEEIADYLEGDILIAEILREDAPRKWFTDVTDDNIMEEATSNVSSTVYPANDEIRTILEHAGLNQPKIDEIVAIPKKQKPLPEDYLSSDYIKQHLVPFEKSGVYKVLATKPQGTIGRQDGTFVLSGEALNKILLEANGDISKVENLLGLSPNYLGANPYIVRFDTYTGLRMSNGSEFGSDPAYWIPGGYTSGGIPEAVIDAAPEGSYSYYQLNQFGG